MTLSGPGRFLVRWLPVLLLLVLAAGAVTAAVSLRDDRVPESGPALDAGSPVTPVLSARRVPQLTGGPIASRRLEAALGDFVAAQDADTCLEVRIADEILFTHRADEPVAPASTQKLLTAAGVLLELGPDEVFETTAVGALPSGGVLEGDLFLIGGGDPLLTTDAYEGTFRREPKIFTDFDLMADAIVEAGITEITGGVVGDESRYDLQRYLPIPEVWEDADIVQDVTGPLSALFVNDGFAGFPGDGNGTTTLEQAPDPSAYAAATLTDLLRIRGVTVRGEARSGTAPAGLEVLATIESPPMREIVTQMLSLSDNSTAELLVKELGFRRSGEGSSAAGTAAVVELLTQAGFDLTGTRVLDGSGVANQNAATCSLLTDLLVDDRIDDVMVDGLAVAGERGTLTNRYEGTPLEGNLRATTGSLRVVSSLAGQLDALQGDRIQFAYVINVGPREVIGPELVEAQEELGNILLGHPDLPDREALGPRT